MYCHLKVENTLNNLSIATHFLFHCRHMWMRTTRTTYWNRLTQGHITTYLPSISSQIDAAYDIPAKGVAYIFTGRVMGSLQSIT